LQDSNIEIFNSFQISKLAACNLEIHSKLAACNLEIHSKLQILQIAILKYSILASRLFGSLIDSWFRPPGSNLLPSSDHGRWILEPASQIIEFNEIPMIFQYSQKPSK
jgi:hypothetical protein